MVSRLCHPTSKTLHTETKHQSKYIFAFRQILVHPQRNRFQAVNHTFEIILLIYKPDTHAFFHFKKRLGIIGGCHTVDLTEKHIIIS